MTDRLVIICEVVGSVVSAAAKRVGRFSGERGMEEASLALRVARLERQNRRQRLVLLALPVVGLLLGAAQVADWKGRSVTTEKLILVDSNGNERGSFAAEAEGSQLVLRDKNGRVRVRTYADYEGKGPAFFLINEKDKVAATLRMIDNGPIMVLGNEDGKHLVTIGKSVGNGVGFIEFYDDKGTLKGGYGGTAFK